MWNKIKKLIYQNDKNLEAYQQNVPLLELPCNSIISNMTPGDYRLISEQSKVHLVFKPEPIYLNLTQQKDRLCTLAGNILSLCEKQPYALKIIFKCNHCDYTRTEVQNLPIIPPPNRYLSYQKCGSPLCKFSSSKSDYMEHELVFIEGFQIHFHVPEHNYFFTGYLEKRHDSGYAEIVKKIEMGFEKGFSLYFHGFVQIEKKRNRYAFYFLIIDVTLLEKRENTEFKLIHFTNENEPNTEKEMIMSLFFSNLKFMKEYLDFSSYELKRSYPDLIIYNQKGSRNVEFEYDVANFFTHGHHEQQNEAICDLIIAWKDSSNQNTFPVLLLEDLDGCVIPQKNSTFLEENQTLYLQLKHLLFFFLRHRKKDELLPLLLPWIDFRSISLPISMDCFLVLENANEKDKEALTLFKEIFIPSPNWKIVCNENDVPSNKNTIVLILSFSEEIEHSEISELQDLYFQQTTQIKQIYDVYCTLLKYYPPLRIGSKLHTKLWQKTNDILTYFKLYRLGGILDGFLGKAKITSENLNYSLKKIILKGLKTN